MSNNSWMVSRPCERHEPHPCPKEDDCCCKKDECHCKKDECCCNKDMKRALKLLFDPSIKYDVDFDEFAFIGKNFLVGTSIDNNDDAKDNITEPDAKLCSLDPCHSDFINIEDNDVRYPIPAYDPEDKDFNINVRRASLCNLDAIVFEYDENPFEFEKKLKKLLDDKYPCCCPKNEECCCGEGIFRDIFTPYASHDIKLNFTAGWLACREARVLGRVGNILVLAHKEMSEKRIYFVCLESIGFYKVDIDC
ncbi:CotA family spore coat protein [Terrisporobacter hibernicus]|uniref:Uncharacterized protein n=1 Tax=Terrisporobacter hibernicus TaxID=2813371 RepID=A0AAX2ZKB2_9FIRM|nr:CotA family spore coat protein [Terrisporobacter hibernicus]UEL48822.1 hypothetical protein JW646_05060 [Terrisporobacter hibernicus]